MEPFNANLKGANAGDHKNFDVDYPADYPDPKLAGKKYHYAVECWASRPRSCRN